MGSPWPQDESPSGDGWPTPPSASPVQGPRAPGPQVPPSTLQSPPTPGDKDEVQVPQTAKGAGQDDASTSSHAPRNQQVHTTQGRAAVGTYHPHPHKSPLVKSYITYKILLQTPQCPDPSVSL